MTRSPSSPPAAMGAIRAGLPVVINIEGGQGTLALKGLRLSRWGRIDHLSMGVPNLRFPFDLSGGAARFRHRRCTMSAATLSFGAEDLVHLLGQAPLAAHGIERPLVELGPDGFLLQARVVIGTHAAELSAVGYFRVAAPRALRLAFYDVRLHGFMPVAAPQVITALLKAVCGSGLSPEDVRSRPSEPAPVLHGPTELVFDPLDLALFDVFPIRGWRLPSRRDLCLSPLAHGGDRLLLNYTKDQVRPEEDLEDFGLAGSGTRSGSRAAYEEGRSLFAEADGMLAAGDMDAALLLYRRASTLHSNNVFVATRLLQLLCASRSTLREAEQMSSALLARLPDFAPALLARAVAAAELGRPLESGELYERLAKASEPLPGLEAATALTAAAEMYLSAGQADRALLLLESVRAARPSHPRTLDVLRQLYAAHNRWADWLTLLRRRQLEEPESHQRAKLLCEAGDVLAKHLSQPQRAAERFAEALVLDEHLGEGWEGLGRSHRALGAFERAREALERAVSLYIAQSNTEAEAGALAELADCEEAMGVDAAADSHWARALLLAPASVDWLRRRARVLARLGRGEEAAELLAAASRACENDDRPERRQDHLDLEVERAGLLGRLLGDRPRGRTALEAVLRSAPTRLGALDELAAQAHPDDLSDVLVFFARALERIVDPALFAAVLTRAREVAQRADDPTFVPRTLAACAGTGSVAGARAAVAWADEVLQPGFEDAALAEPNASAEVDLPVALTEALMRYHNDPPSPLGELQGEIALCVARLAQRQGRLDEAKQAYEAGLQRQAAMEVEVELARHLASLHEQQGDHGAAARTLADLAQHAAAKGNAITPLQLGGLWEKAARHYEALGDESAAVHAWTQAAHADPQRSGAWRALLSHHERSKDDAAFLAALQHHAAAAKGVERRDALCLLGQKLAQQDKLEEAEEAFVAALAVDADHVFTLQWLAARTWDQGRLDQSAVFSQRLLDSAARGLTVPSFTLADAHLRLARWDRLMGSLPDAEQHLGQAVAHEPHGASLSLLVDVLESSGERQTLLEALQTRLDSALQPPERHDVEVALAGALERAGRSEEAVAVYKRQLERAPEDVETLRRLVELCRRESRFDELLETLQRLIVVAQTSAAEVEHELDVNVLRLEVARALWRSGRDVQAAEQQLRDLVQADPGFKEAAETLGRLLLSRGAWKQADEVLAEAGLLELTSGAVTPAPSLAIAEASALVVERARARLDGEAGEVAAYDVLHATPLDQLPPEGLALRASLAHTLGSHNDVADVLFEAGCRLDTDEAPLLPADRDAYLKLSELQTPGQGTLSMLEQLARRGCLDEVRTNELAALYDGLTDPAALLAAQDSICDLLDNGARLPVELRCRLWTKLAQASVAGGDVSTAEERFGHALEEPVGAALRADVLVGRAHFAESLSALESALGDLDEALSIAPHHAGALAARAELSYRLQDWSAARRTYEALASQPEATRVIDPVVLHYRRAELAEMFGEEAAAEACYREVLTLEPDHVEAREALAQFASLRGDSTEVVALLTPLLQSLPDKLGVRRAALAERLGTCLAQLGHIAEALPHLQEAVRLEPRRGTALAALAEAQEQLGHAAAAADVWHRLSRSSSNSRERALALFREGELRRLHLNDEVSAADAYLRSADMDPTFAPTLVRLVPYYWQRGDVLEVAGVAADLHASEAGRAAEEQDNLAVVLAISCSAAGDDVLASKVAPTSWPASLAISTTLVELASHAPDANAARARVIAAWTFLRHALTQEQCAEVDAAVRQVASAAEVDSSPALVAALVQNQA